MREDGMTEIIALLAGVFIGILVMGLLAADCYDRGAEDERAKIWRNVIPESVIPESRRDDS